MKTYKNLIIFVILIISIMFILPSVPELYNTIMNESSNTDLKNIVNRTNKMTCETVKHGNSKNKIILYYSSNCKWCHKMYPEWIKLWNTILNNNKYNDITIEEYCCGQENCYDINSFPTIMLIKDDTEIEYDLERTETSMLQAIKHVFLH